MNGEDASAAGFGGIGAMYTAAAGKDPTGCTHFGNSHEIP
jgi:hypothetical protein